MKRRLLLVVGASQWVLPLQAKPDDPQLVAVRVWPATAYTRVTLESDKVLPAKHFLTVEGPQRLVVDIEGLDLSPRLKELVAKTQTDDPNIAAVRVGQYQPRIVRIVFDLKQPIEPQVFTLKPVAAYQHRLVLDLYPKASTVDDPLLALIMEREKALAAPEPSTDTPPPEPAKPSKPATPAAPAEPNTTPARPARGRLERLIVVAIDAGNGGEDPGAIGPTGLREKDVVLSVARQLRERLEKEPRLRVLMTRDGDYFVPLHERVRKARKVGADLFVSIHADAFLRPQARGASVFALSDGAATSAAARWMAQRENAADAVGGLNTVAVKDNAVLRTMLDMSTTAQIKDSLQLGTDVLGHLGKVGRLHKPRVEQAGFAVLRAPDVPSILVETAFISNPEEEEKLRDPVYLARLVEAVARGILRYLGRRPALKRAPQST